MQAATFHLLIFNHVRNTPVSVFLGLVSLFIFKYFLQIPLRKLCEAVVFTDGTFALLIFLNLHNHRETLTQMLGYHSPLVTAKFKFY